MAAFSFNASPLMNATQIILARACEPAIRARIAILFAATGKPLVRISYAEFTGLVNRAAQALVTLGVGRGERVLLLMHDSPLYAASILAVMQVGAVAVPLNTKLAAEDYAFIASDAKPRLLLADDVFANLVTDVRGCRVLFTQGDTEHGTERKQGFAESFTSAVSRASAQAPNLPATAQTSADDPAFWLYSSGTTGRPKAVIHSHRSAAHSSKLLREVVHACEETVVFATSKLFFAFALDNGFFGVIKAGATLVLNQAWAEPETVLQQAEEARPTVFLTVPTLFRRLLALPPARLAVFKTIPWYFTGGERLPDVLAVKWKEVTGHDLLVCYGMSETFCNTLSMRPEAVRLGSCGTPLDGVETRLLSREGEPATPSEPGEPGVLWLKHPSLALRYLHDEPTAKAFDNGWFCTNDQFRVDAEGFWFHEGRADDLLKIAGQWVKPNAVEEAALIPIVREAACVVVPDADGMERLALYVVPNGPELNDRNVTGALRPTLAAALPAHSLPKWIRTVEELPRTPTGKVQRFKLKALLLEELVALPAA